VDFATSGHRPGGQYDARKVTKWQHGAGVRLGYGNDGRRHRRVVYGSDKSIILERLARMRAQALDGLLENSERLAVSLFLARWLKDVARPTVSPATHQLYEGLIRLHITPRIGPVGLSRLTRAHVQGMLAAMERDGSSPRLRQMPLGVLTGHSPSGSVGNVSRNACDAVSRPRVPHEAMQTFAPEQVTRLLGTARAIDLKRCTSSLSPRGYGGVNCWV
jgi:Phage integrase, N-terminal SAM-like domain